VKWLQRSNSNCVNSNTEGSSKFQDLKSSSPLYLLINGTTVMWIFVIALVFWNSYRGINWIYALSFDVEDGWCVKNKQGLGGHCFGDFGLMYEIGLSANSFITSGPGATVTPFSAIIFKVLSFFEYDVALMGMFTTYCLLMVHMLYKATRNLHSTHRLYLIVFLGLLTLGTLTALDRMNPILFIPFLLYCYLTAIEEKRFTKAAILISLMVSIKFWALLFIVPIVYAKKVKALVFAIALSMTLYIVPLLILPGSLVVEMKNSLESILDREYGSGISKYSISTYGLILKLKCFLNSTTCEPTRLGDQFSRGILLVLFLAFLYIFISIFSIKTLSEYPDIKYVPLISIGYLSVPEAASYNAVLMSTIVAIYVHYNQRSFADRSKEVLKPSSEILFINKATMLALVLTMPPLAAFGNLVFSDFKTLRIQTVLIPITWNILLLLIIWNMVHMRRKSPERIKEKKHEGVLE
jgi:Glycosyltransferase family 87